MEAKKTLIACCLAGSALMSGPALAVDYSNPTLGNVTIYGFLNPSAERVWASAGTATPELPSRNRVNSNASLIGLRGTRDLGKDFQLVWQAVSYFGINDGSLGTMGNGDNHLGIKGSFGTLSLGQWDTPFRMIENPVDLLNQTTFGSTYGITGGNSSLLKAGNVVNRESFARRATNSVIYDSPTINGFHARVQHGTNQEKDGTNGSPSLWSTSLTYGTGSLKIAYGYERHTDYGGAGTGDDGHRLGVIYTLGNTKFGAQVERLTWDGNLSGANNGFSPISIKGVSLAGANRAVVEDYYFSVSHTMGPHILRAAYGADRGVKLDGNAIPASKARLAVLGYGYVVNENTQLYALFARLKNDANSANRFDGQANGLGTSFTPQAGSTSTGVGVGLRYIF